MMRLKSTTALPHDLMLACLLSVSSLFAGQDVRTHDTCRLAGHSPQTEGIDSAASSSEAELMAQVGAIPGLPERPTIILATFFAEFLPGLRAIAGDFQKETGIRLSVQGIPYMSYEMWLHTRFLGDNVPELLLLETTGIAWQYGQAGLLMNLDDTIELPNPLSAEARPWKEHFRESYIQQSRDVNGHLFLIPYTQFGVGFFYNMKMYAEAGLTPPATWRELLGNLRTLHAKGMTALVTALKPDDAQTVWMAGILLECMTRVHVPEVNLRTDAPDWKFDPFDRRTTLSEHIDLSERIVAFEKGIIDPARAPEFAEVARMIKEQSVSWRADFLSVAGAQIHRIFAAGKTAHMMNGTWFLPVLDSTREIMEEVAPDSVFEYGIFPFPELTTNSTLLARAGGVNQNAGMRACLLVPVHKEQWRTEAGLLLCHYLTLPRVAKKVFSNCDVYDIPAVKAVGPKPETEPLLPKKEFAFLPVCSFTGYDAQSVSEFYPLWQLYLSDRISLESFLKDLSANHRRALVRLSRVYKAEIDSEFIHRELGHDFDKACVP